VDCTAARVAGGDADPIPRGDRPAVSRLIIDCDWLVVVPVFL
jgi:hypothetical protein